MSEITVMDEITKALTEFHVAKSRKGNNLSETERERLITQLEEIIQPLIEKASEQEADQEQTSEVKVTQTSPQWVGESKRDDIRIEAEKKAEILDAWLEAFGIDRNIVLTAHIGNKYFYTAPSEQEEDIHELWVEKVA